MLKQLKIEDKAEFKTILDQQKDAIRAVITEQAEKPSCDKKND